MESSCELNQKRIMILRWVIIQKIQQSDPLFPPSFSPSSFPVNIVNTRLSELTIGTATDKSATSNTVGLEQSLFDTTHKNWFTCSEWVMIRNLTFKLWPHFKEDHVDPSLTPGHHDVSELKKIQCVNHLLSRGWGRRPRSRSGSAEMAPDTAQRTVATCYSVQTLRDHMLELLIWVCRD